MESERTSKEKTTEHPNTKYMHTLTKHTKPHTAHKREEVDIKTQYAHDIHTVIQ